MILSVRLALRVDALEVVADDDVDSRSQVVDVDELHRALELLGDSFTVGEVLSSVTIVTFLARTPAGALSATPRLKPRLTIRSKVAPAEPASVPAL